MECVTGTEYLLYNKPCVYVWKDKDGVVLYVGMSTKGLYRPIGPHEVINVIRQIEETDTITFEWFKSSVDAASREKELIALLYPKFNKQKMYAVELLRKKAKAGKDSDVVECENCGTQYTPNRKWQRFCTDKCRTEFFVENGRRPVTQKGPSNSECAYCGRAFVKGRPWTKFCSVQCRTKSWLREHPSETPSLYVSCDESEQCAVESC